MKKSCHYQEKFMMVELKESDMLQLIKEKKTKFIKRLSLPNGKKHAYKLIDEWAK